MKTRKTISLLLVLTLLIPAILPSQVFADDQDGEYYHVRTITLEDGTNIDEVMIDGPPTPPLGYMRPIVGTGIDEVVIGGPPMPPFGHVRPTNGAGIDEVVIDGPPTPPLGYTRPIVGPPESMLAAASLSDVPAFDWSYGCSATSGAMIAGYYDRTGHANMYAGPTNGGVMPLDNSAWGAGECPLSATHNGYDGRTILGHVDDYWIAYGSPLPDPFITGGWTEHTYGDCTGDYMKTNQSNFSNSDGSTRFWFYTSGAPFHWYQMEAGGYHTDDGGYGVKLFYESRGYTVSDMYNQYILGYGSPTQGFTYDQYKAEIDAGRPVMIHVEGHTMVGFGYDDSTSNLMYIHDTWDYLDHTMIWGGSYSGMQHMGVTIVQLEEQQPELDFGDAPDPPYCTLAASNGASHIVVPGAPFLGLADPTDDPDMEPDGQPDPGAMGDDNAGTDPDDEDGVSIPVLQPGQQAAITFEVNNAPAWVDGWIDFNGSGVWGDMGGQEYVVSGIYAPGVWTTGVNAPAVNVPPDAVPGQTFARFRINSFAPLPPCGGPADDGEVEDHMVEIEEPPVGTIIVEKQTDPDGAPDMFTFTGDAAGNISDDGQIVVSGLPPGTYTSQETVPAGWNLTSIACDDGNSSGDVSTGTATFILEAGETIICVFTNTQTDNTPPTLSGLPDQIIDHTTILPATIDLWAYAWDAETPVSGLTYTIEGTPPAGAGVTIVGNQYIHVNPSAYWCGYTDVTIRVTDPGGLWDTDTFRVAVTWSCPG